MIIPNISPQRQALAITSGISLIFFFGIAAALALAIGVVWALAQLLLLALESIVECMNAIGATYAGADPLVKFLLLVSIAYVAYRAARVAVRKRERA